MASDDSTSDNKTKIVIAIISLIGVLAAAIITIVPQVIELSRKSGDQANSPPVAFNRYDDPSSIFSIEYPAGLFLRNREVVDNQIIVSISSDGDSSEGISINVRAGERPNYPL